MATDWKPKTELGRKVAEGQLANFDEVLASGKKIMEPQIIDHFFPELKTDYIMIGQAKGKFGGGKRRVYKHTQKKVREGARMKFSYVVVVGNGDGYIGVGKGASRQSMQARETAIKAAKLSMIKIVRACGSWECGCGKAHSVPFAVEGKSGSNRMVLYPAPRGTGLVVHDEAKRILRLAGISDAWSKTFGDTRSRINLAYATFAALRNAGMASIPQKFKEMWGAK